MRAKSSVSGADLLDEMRSRGHTEAYILDDDKQFVGKISIYEVISAVDSNIEAHIDRQPLTLYADDSLAEAMAKVSQFVGESVPVVDTATGQLCGSLAEGALFQAVIDVQNQARSLER